MNAERCHLDNDFPKLRLLPQDQIGRRFTEYFSHGWHFIYAPLPAPGEKPQWRTELRYPLEPRNLWSRYKDNNLLLGLRFDEYTRYLLLDIDRHSDNHPDNNPQHYQQIRYLLEEELGLCRSVCVRSSDSHGIHLYYFLPHPVHCFRLAAAVRQVLETAGYDVRGGQLEIFPNTKPYGETVITDYNAHRLPLQSGSFLLDDDFQPISNSVATLLNWADQTASAQDMETLTAALAHTPKAYQPRQPHRTQYDDNQQFQQDVVEILRQGWTGYGQTNDMLIAIAKHGIIFLGLWGQDLTTYIRDTAISTPGYRQWSRHQHEIDKRSQEVARSAERYYTRLHSGKPPRSKTYKQNFYGGEERTSNVIPFLPQQQLHEQTLERITATVAMLKAEGQFPDGVYRRTKAISGKSQEVFGVGVSPTTLYKEEYKPLWHPAHEQSPVGEGVNPDATVGKDQDIPDPWEEEIEPPNLALVGHFQGLHHLPPNEGIYTLTLALPSGVGESAAFKPELRILSQECNFQNHSQEVNSTDSTILQIHSHSETISSSVFNSCDDRVSDCFSPAILNDKNFQYPPVAEARVEKSEILDKYPLSIAEMQAEIDLEPLPAHPTFPQRPADSNFAINPEITQPLSTPPSTPSLPNSSPSASPPQHDPASLPSSVTPGVDFSPEDYPSVVSFPLSSETTVVLDTTASNPIYTPEQYREAIRLRLQALPQAKRWVRLFSDIEGIALLPSQRQQLEKFLQYHLMLASPSPILQQEAAAWFAAHGDIIAGVRDFEVFWQYCQQLL